CKDFFRAGRGIYEDLFRRLPLYSSDFTDGIVGSNKTVLKYMTTTIFLYIAILLPAIAFGSLNDERTRGEIVIRCICDDYDLDFPAFYACIVFHKYYHASTLTNGSGEALLWLQEQWGVTLLGGNGTGAGGAEGGGVGGFSSSSLPLPDSFIQSTRERPVLCLLLMLGTLWLGYTLYQFKH
ncbi:unnamed protein product, partial [Coregonus sp. 'balchen']